MSQLDSTTKVITITKHLLKTANLRWQKQLCHIPWLMELIKMIKIFNLPNRRYFGAICHIWPKILFLRIDTIFKFLILQTNHLVQVEFGTISVTKFGKIILLFSASLFSIRQNKLPTLVDFVMLFCQFHCSHLVTLAPI